MTSRQYLSYSGPAQPPSPETSLDEAFKRAALEYLSHSPLSTNLRKETGLGWPWGPDDNPTEAREHFVALSRHLTSRLTSAWATSFNYEVLRSERSDLAGLSRFSQHVEYASFHLYVAFDKAQIKGQRVRKRKYLRLADNHNTINKMLVATTFARYDNLRKLLSVDWVPPVEVELLTRTAFFSLCELTPADTQLRHLVGYDWRRAVHALTEQLDGVAEQLKGATRLADELETKNREAEEAQEKLRRDQIEADLLARAGQALTLTEAASRLGVTRQNLHKRIKVGSALGVKKGADIVVPSAQFIDREGRTRIVENLVLVLRPFAESGAGSWSALQFLVEVDPLLGSSPLDSLREGNWEAVSRATWAYLGQDGS